MAPPNLENDLHTSLSRSTVAEDSISSYSLCDIDYKGEINKSLQALELLLSKVQTPQCRDALEQFRSFFSNTGNACSGYSDINKIYKNLIESLDKETDLDHTALCQVLGLDKKQAELDDAFDLDDLKEEKIAGFNKEKLLKMLDFSKVSYGDKDGKLTKDGYKTKRQFAEEDYQIIQFFEDERTENQYCPDENYKLEQRSYGYDLICSNSWNRDAGYIFIKGEEVTIAYHGTRDGSDIKTDFDAYLIKLPFLPEDNSVHSGFYSLFKRSWPSVHKILQGLANERGSAIKDLKINITGHSMGGALASVAALCLNKTENAENVHVATFGSPRVFYKDAAKVYSDCLGKKTIRVACTSDNIPCVPFGGGHEYYKHVGQTLKLEANKTTLIPDATMYYHRLDTYRNLINELKQESFKSDNSPSWWYYLAYPTGRLLSNIPIKVSEDNDKEFFEKVKGENKDIKFSEIPIKYAPNLEEKFRQGKQEVTQLTNDKTQLEERLNNIQQSLAEKTEEFKSAQIQLEQERSSVSERLTQEQQKTSKFSDQVDKLTEALRGIEDQLAKRKAELNGQTKKVTKLNDTIKELKETNAELERKNSNLANRLEKLEEAKTKLEEKAEFAEEELVDAQTQLKESERGLDVAKENILQLERNLKQAQQNLAKETSKTTQLSKESSKIRAQLEEKKKEIGELKGEVAQLTTQKTQLEGQLNYARQGLTDKTDEVTQLTQVVDTLNSQIAQLTVQNTQLEGQLINARQDFTNQIDEVTQLKKVADTLNNNEGLNDKNLGINTYSKKQGIYAVVSFVLSGAFAVGASLTMLHLAICISFAVAALTFLAVGCYCSYQANTALNNIEVSQIGNDSLSFCSLVVE